MKVLKDREKVTGYFKERFGIDEKVFSGVEFIETRKAVWMVSPDIVSGENLKLLGLKRLNYTGIRLLRKTGPNSYKPTTYGLQLIGQGATRNVIDLTKEELSELLDKGSIALDKEDLKGFIIIRYNGLVLGCGLVKEGVLYSQLPKGRAEALRAGGLF